MESFDRGPALYDVLLHVTTDTFDKESGRLVRVGEHTLRQRFMDRNWRVDLIKIRHIFIGGQKPELTETGPDETNAFAFDFRALQARFYSSPQNFGQFQPLDDRIVAKLQAPQLFESFREPFWGQTYFQMLQPRLKDAKVSSDGDLVTLQFPPCSDRSLRINDAEYRFEIVLDPSKGYMPVLIRRSRPSGNMRVETANELTKTESGLWVPHKTTRTIYSKLGTGDLNVPLNVVVEDIDMARSNFNIDIDPVVFQLPFPPGTVVRDEFQHVNYIQAKDGTQDLKAYDNYVQSGIQHAGPAPKSAADDVPNVAAYLRQRGYVDDTDAAQQTNKASTNTPTNSVKRRFGDTPAGRLLDRLQKQNASESLFKDPWLRTLKEIVDLGPDAVPELIDELDATNDHRMLSCLGFTLRAIGDPRAVPALIRAIPKTLESAGYSDIGSHADDEQLARFAQKYDLDKDDRGNSYGFGRPVREIFGALEKLTGQNFGDMELWGVFQSGTQLQQRTKRALYYRTAKKWADWWQQNAANYTQDPKYTEVGLSEPAAETTEPPQPNGHYKTSNGGMSGVVLQSISYPKSQLNFYDLDTGRRAGLPNKWRDSQNIESHLDDILAWAASEGFDLMGVDYIAPNGQHHFAIRPIGLRAWELGANRWKMKSNDITIEALQAEGIPVNGLLLHFDKQKKAIDPTAIAPFFYMTREGTPGMLYVGVEVLDDSLKPGGPSMVDPEREPVAFTKGRRFGYSEFEELTSRSK